MGCWSGNVTSEWLKQQEINRRVDEEWYAYCKEKPVYRDNPSYLGMKHQFNAQSRKRIDEEEVEASVKAALAENT